jgi:hypothetical protein
MSHRFLPLLYPLWWLEMEKHKHHWPQASELFMVHCCFLYWMRFFLCIVLIVYYYFQYPVYVEGNSHLSPTTPLQRAFSGLTSSDEICCITGLSSQQLEEETECDPGVTVIWKWPIAHELNNQYYCKIIYCFVISFCILKEGGSSIFVT